MEFKILWAFEDFKEVLIAICGGYQLSGKAPLCESGDAGSIPASHHRQGSERCVAGRSKNDTMSCGFSIEIDYLYFIRIGDLGKMADYEDSKSEWITALCRCWRVRWSQRFCCSGKKPGLIGFISSLE